MRYVMFGILCMCCVAFGWALRGIMDSRILQSPVMAYGYEESTQLWHRIRVNDKGQLLCAKE